MLTESPRNLWNSRVVRKLLWRHPGCLGNGAGKRLLLWRTPWRRREWRPIARPPLEEPAEKLEAPGTAHQLIESVEISWWRRRELHLGSNVLKIGEKSRFFRSNC